MLRPAPIALPGDAVTTKLCELRSLFLFEKLTDAQLGRLCQRGRIEVFPAGPVYTEGDPARSFYVLLEGSLVLSRRVGADDIEVGRTSQRGVYAGAWEAYLTASAGQVYNSSVRVTETSRFFVLDAEVFATLMHEWFPEGAFFGARNMYELTGQRERLLAFGSLSAGLTHELNNPAAATVRAAATLRERIADMRRQLSAITGGPDHKVTLETLTELQEEAAERVPMTQALSPLEASDREDAITGWLDSHGLGDSWRLAPAFVAAGLDVTWLEHVAVAVDAGPLAEVLRWLADTVETELLTNEIEGSATRISTLVGAAKQYSQLDRAPEQVVDVHELVDSTLAMLAGKIPQGIRVVQDYDRSLPAIPVYAAELNQAWTNVIDNALAAMGETGVLTVRTGLDHDHVFVEISDTGPGVPPDPGADIRALLHHQTSGPRHRARPQHRLAHRGQQAPREHPGGVRPRQHPVHGVAASYTREHRARERLRTRSEIPPLIRLEVPPQGVARSRETHGSIKGCPPAWQAGSWQGGRVLADEVTERLAHDCGDAAPGGGQRPGRPVCADARPRGRPDGGVHPGEP
jgi:signal transduction histidine kinase